MRLFACVRHSFNKFSVYSINRLCKNSLYVTKFVQHFFFFEFSIFLSKILEFVGNLWYGVFKINN